MVKRCAVLLTAGLLLSGCSLPPIKERTASQALSSDETRDTRIGRGLSRQIEAHPGLSGVLTLQNPVDAFVARKLLATAAECTLDVQYYIWRDDITGTVLLQALEEAAQRGVRVRLLLDDNGIPGLDDQLALLNARPNVEVRLFNPFPFRAFKPLGFVTDFKRVNRRMHNKSFTVDGQVTVVGGRNIGDEYFGATQGIEFADLDLMLAGPIVDEVSRDFDRYWSSASAYPLEKLVGLPGEQQQAQLQSVRQARLETEQAHAYYHTAHQSQLVEALHEGRLSLQWMPVRMVSDDPAKALDRAEPETLLLARLQEVLDRPVRSVDLVSPYFVPTEAGVNAFRAMAQSGVRMRILTNALEATDVSAVHAGYAPARKPLLEAGISLYEMRRDQHGPHVKEKAGPFGSSGSSLHAKTFAVDGERVFVGSFNFDPRSARLNTELGFVLEAPELAEVIGKTFDSMVDRAVYQVKLDQSGQLVWVLQDEEGEKIFRHEPSTGWWKRLYIRFLSLLPIEGLL